MPAKLIEQKNNTLTVQFTVELTGQMLNDEQALQQSLNEAGQAAMVPMLKQFDTNGEPIRVNGVKQTVKDYAPQTYETPYGSVSVERYTYQTSQGGRAYVPLEADGRMVLNSTPRYAQMVSGKYARLGADAIREDLLESNGRDISRNYAKKLDACVKSQRFAFLPLFLGRNRCFWLVVLTFGVGIYIWQFSCQPLYSCVLFAFV